MLSSVYGTTERMQKAIELVWSSPNKIDEQFHCCPDGQDSKLRGGNRESPQLDKYETKIWKLTSYLLPFAQFSTLI